MDIDFNRAKKSQTNLDRVERVHDHMLHDAGHSTGHHMGPHTAGRQRLVIVLSLIIG